MLKRYEKFLEVFDKKLEQYFSEQSEHICCKIGCSECCETGDYPFTELEMHYLFEGFKSLDAHNQTRVRNNIIKIKRNRVSTHLYYKCPFLIDKKCCVYKYRGLTCRVYGLAYLTKGNIVKVPECVHRNLCYGKVFKDNFLCSEPVKEDLSLLSIISDNAAKYKLKFGISRSLIDWF